MSFLIKTILSAFIPFFLNKWLKLNFALTYGFAIICLILAYAAHHFIFKQAGIR